MELHASGGTLRITDAVSGRRLLYAVGPEGYRFGERRVIAPDGYPVTGSGSVPTEVVSEESAGITVETQVFVIDLAGESFVVAGSAGRLVPEDQVIANAEVWRSCSGTGIGPEPLGWASVPE